MFSILLFLLLCTSVVSHQIYTCHDNITTVKGGAYLFSPDFPKNITDRKSCFFNFSEPGNYVLYFTEGYITNFKITINSTYELIYDMYYAQYNVTEFKAETISFEFLDMTENSTGYGEWQAFQFYIYNNVDDPYCEKVFHETFDNITYQGYPLTFAISPSICQIPPDRDRINFTVIIDITTSSADSFKGRIACNTTGDTIISNTLIDAFCTDNIIPVSFYTPHHTEMTYYYSSTNLPSADDPDFQLVIALSPTGSGAPTNCSLNPISGHINQLSIYNPIDGYSNNIHCVINLTPPKGYHIFFEFEFCRYEAYFDFLMIQSVFSPTGLQLNNYEVAVAPEAMTVVEFQSDASISYAGFILNITEFNCTCSNDTIVIPCTGSKIKYYSDDLHNERAICESACSFKVEVDEECYDSKPYVTVVPPPRMTTDGHDYNYFDVYFIHNNQPISILDTGKFVFKVDNSSWFQYQNNYYSLAPIFTTFRSFKIVLTAVEQPIVIRENLTESNPYIVYDLRKPMENTFLEISTPNQLELFLVAEDETDFFAFDIYDESRVIFVLNCGNLTLNDKRKFMPKFFSTNSQISVYKEHEIEQSPVFAYFRIPEVALKNCMFEHNVIDASQIVDTNKPVTMVNNGTGYCNIVILNPLREPVIMKELWTDSKYDEVLFYIGDELKFNFTKDTSATFDSQQLGIGKQHFSLPPRKSFSVLLYRQNSKV